MDMNLKIKDLADILGVTPDTIINWEIRAMRPQDRKIQDRVAKFLKA